MLSDEQIKQIKKQLFQQIENFPEDKKEFAKQQVESMDSEQLEEFLQQHNLVKNPQENTQQCIFCSIVAGAIPSHKIDENEKAIAILEINPISLGHTIIIPKEHISLEGQIPEEAFALAKKIEEKIKKKLTPKSVLISPANVLGHEAINILPVYENETMSSQRKKASPEELEELQNQLTKEEIKEVKKEEPEEINEQNTWLPKRIP